MKVFFIAAIVSGLIAITTSQLDKESLMKAILQTLLDDSVNTQQRVRRGCDDPPDVPNASNTAPDNTAIGARVTYTCNAGYMISGSPAIECLRSGWTTLPRCDRAPQMVIGCGPPPPEIEFGVFAHDLSDSTNTLGSKKYYKCIDGFEITSINDQGMAETDVVTERVCQQDGMWSMPGSCEAVDCGALPSPIRGSVDTPMTTFSSVATYSCGNYNLVGDKERTCQLNKMWSGQQPVCESCKAAGVACSSCYECCYGRGMRCTRLGSQSQKICRYI